ncbi:MAG: polymer-forming cytoskeletal protein [Thermoplasmata archaeon]|nr:polymer-forming cytoskeletal protein [Thermoplasmata archaeon]
MSERKDLIIPPGSRIADGRAAFKGDVVLSDHSACSMGVTAEGRVFAGQGVRVAGGIAAEGDVCLDRSTVIEGDVASQGSVSIGERVRVEGKVFAGGDLDVASEVRMDGGYDVRGWINVRSPLPIVIQFVIVVMELLRQGRSDEVEKILQELEEMQTIKVNEGYAFVPNGSSLGDIVGSKGGCRVGDGSIVPGIAAEDWVRVGCGAEVFGNVEAGAEVSIAEGALVHGDVVARRKVILGPGVHIGGSVRADSATVARDAVVKGSLIAPRGVRFTDPPRAEMEERLSKFEVGMEGVTEMLQ